VGFALNVAACVLGYFVVESVPWLVSIGRKDEAIKRLHYIAKVNGVSDFAVSDLASEKFETIEPEKAAGKNSQSSPRNNSGIGIEEDEQQALGKEGLLSGDVTREEEKDAATFCSDKALLCNLILMTIFWTTGSFNYYIMTFYLKYIPGNIFVNTSLSCTAEIIAYICSGFVMNLFGVKLAYMISFILAAVGGILLVIFFNAEGALIATFVLFAKFGISFAFNISYLATPKMFPTILTSTAFGICNVFARFATILSPLIAELPDPVPMSIFAITCIGSALLPLFLR